VSLQSAKEWLGHCVTTHNWCTSEPLSGRWYPSRLLDLDDPTQDGLTSLRVITTKLHSLEGHYTTLSHRWGQAKFLQLTRHNLEEFHRRIPTAELPQTFQEAIFVSKFLGIRYLWIDSLCIIQDDPSDWASEASNMHMVYSNSYCNIAASHAEDSTKGLFRDRNPHALCSTEVNICTSSYYTTKKARQVCVLANDDMIADSMDHCPLSKRGWVLQERVLAPRVLHFARDQIFFECRTHIASELYNAGVPDSYHEFPLASMKANDAFRKEDLDSWYEMWQTWIEAYSLMSLTYPSDKLIAISGVAKMVQSVVGDEYVAGMWRKDLLYQLVWHGGRTNIRPPVYRAPSWSWASVDGIYWPASFPYFFQEMEAEIADLHIEYATEDKTGQILGGWLDLKGSLWSVQLKKDTPTGENWVVNIGEETHGLKVFLDDNSLKDNIIVQQSAAAEHFSMYVAMNYYLILRLADNTKKLYERIGLAQGYPYSYPWDLDEETRKSLPCIRHEGGKHTIRII
jgi:hypothetical protein